MSGKGSKRRPQSVSDEDFKDNWDSIFNSNLDRNNYQDILSTEDCFSEVFEKLKEMEKGS